MFLLTLGCGRNNPGLNSGHCGDRLETVTNEQFYKRGTSFHGSRQSHEPVRRTVMKSTLKVPSYRQLPLQSTSQHSSSRLLFLVSCISYEEFLFVNQHFYQTLGGCYRICPFTPPTQDPGKCCLYPVAQSPTCPLQNNKTGGTRTRPLLYLAKRTKNGNS